MTIYADSSFFVSLYLMDRHSEKARRRVSRHPRIWLTPLHRAEWVHAIEQHVFRGEISPQESRRFFEDFERDRRAGLWVEVGLPEMVFETCAALARRHVARLGGRTLECLHVATAVELKAKHFWTFDIRQAKIAEAEGLKTSSVY